MADIEAFYNRITTESVIIEWQTPYKKSEK